MVDIKSYSVDWEIFKFFEIFFEGYGKWISGGLKDVVLDILFGGECVGFVFELG